jgi:hypothetical protein
MTMTMVMMTTVLIMIVMIFQLYQGYADDYRNTDNAWLETSVVNYHDDTGEILTNFELRVRAEALFFSRDAFFFNLFVVLFENFFNSAYPRIIFCV